MRTAVRKYPACKDDKTCTDINTWCVVKVKDMSDIFYDKSAEKCYFTAAQFNHDISKWDVSSATNMHGMFRCATKFNQPLKDWDVSSATDMGYMFLLANAFNQTLNDWNVSSVTTMFGMFVEAKAFNQPLNDWDVSKVANMFTMFSDATAFNQNLCSWNDQYKGAGSVNTSYMFHDSGCDNKAEPTDINWCNGVCK